MQKDKDGGAGEKKGDEYVPPKVWTYKVQGGTFGGLNRPTAGPQNDTELPPRGKHALQLYSLATPNGVKVTSLLEELHAAYGLEYDAYTISITAGDQFSKGFVSVNPNSKIPALLHYAKDTEPPTRLFESAHIMMYLCEQFDTNRTFLPAQGTPEYIECLNWLFWLQGSAPYVGGGYGHFYRYAPIKLEYPINRFAMETKRQLDVLERHLAGKDGNKKETPYICGDNITIADLCIFPWHGAAILDKVYPNTAEFLSVHEYPALLEWAKRVAARPAVKRGTIVNKTWGDVQLRERHSAADIDEAFEAADEKAKAHSADDQKKAD